MKISCPSCSAKYSIADDKVQSRLAKIRCRKCGTSIVIDGNVAPPHVYAAEGGAVAGAPVAAPQQAAVGASYSVDLGENDQRQMNVQEIVAAYNNGAISAETFVWTDGFADWMALSQVEEIVSALHNAAMLDAPTAPADETSALSASTAPHENPWESAGHHPAPAPFPSPGGGGIDLFGNVATAGGDHDFGAALGNPSPHAGGGLSADTGARNESSVLFSLSALTAGAAPSRPGASSSPMASIPPSPSNDDSGLIDLAALTASAEAMGHGARAHAAPPPVMVSPLAAAPLGGPQYGMHHQGLSASIPPMQQKGNKNGLIIGGFLFAAIVVGAIILSGGGDEDPVVPPAAPTAVAAPIVTAPVPAALPTADALPSSDAKPPSTGSDAEESSPKKSGPRPKASSKPKAAADSSSSSSSSSPAPAPKPATKGKCGCKSDDLMCLMNCAQ